MHQAQGVSTVWMWISGSGQHPGYGMGMAALSGNCVPHVWQTSRQSVAMGGV